MAELLQVVQIAVSRLFGARRLQDECRDSPRVLVEQSLSASDVVVTESDRQLSHRFRDTCIHLCRADEPVIGGKEGVIGATGDNVAARVGSRQPNGPGCRIGPVLAELHHLGPIDQSQELFSAFHLDA